MSFLYLILLVMPFAIVIIVKIFTVIWRTRTSLMGRDFVILVLLSSGVFAVISLVLAVKGEPTAALVVAYIQAFVVLGYVLTALVQIWIDLKRRSAPHRARARDLESKQTRTGPIPRVDTHQEV